MKRVWLVMANTQYEGSDVVSVHRTGAGAKLERDRLQEAMDKANERRRAWLDSDDERETPWPEGIPDCDSLTVSGEWRVCR